MTKDAEKSKVTRRKTNIFLHIGEQLPVAFYFNFAVPMVVNPTVIVD